MFQESRTRFVIDPIARTVMLLPGSVMPLTLILATFGIKFWLGFEMATATDIAALGTYDRRNGIGHDRGHVRRTLVHVLEGHLDESGADYVTRHHR